MLQTGLSRITRRRLEFDGVPISAMAIAYTIATVPAVLLMIGLFAYPMGEFFLKSLIGSDGGFRRYLEIVNGSVERHVILNTLRMSLVTTMLVSVAGYPVAVLIARVRPRVARLLLLLVLVPFWTSILVRSYAWMVLLGRRGLVNTSLVSSGVIERPLTLMFNLVGVLIGMVHILLPYMILSILSSMKRVNPEILLASDSLGARPIQTFGKVLFPLTLPGVVGGGVLVFTMSLGFYITPALLGGRRDIVVSMLIVDRITQYLAWGEAAAMAAVLLGVTAAMYLVCTKGLRAERLFVGDME